MKTLLGKALVLIMLIIALSAGVMSVRETIGERLSYRESALDSVTASLPNDLQIAGVVLIQPYIDRFPANEPYTGARAANDVKTANGQPADARSKRTVRQVIHEVPREFVVLPDSLDVVGSLLPDQRRIGLFRIMAYQFNGHIKGSLTLPSPDDLPRVSSKSALTLGHPRLVLVMSDTRGLHSIQITIDGHDAVVEAGTGIGELAGIRVPLKDDPTRKGTVSFDATLSIGGTGRFNVVPLAQQNRMAINSPWAHPSFLGDFLPVERTVRDNGFDAMWEVSSLATSAGRAWQNALQPAAIWVDADGDVATSAKSRPSRVEADAFSVQLIEPVDIYSLADRATKYAFMFILLTLGIFMVYELLKRMRVHAIQYLLVGAAQLIFFLLLLALSEHIGFALAYLTATVACVGLIGYYIAAVLKSACRGLGFAALLALLYGALYVILQSEQNSLLLGSVLVFMVLAVIMIATRRTDWHEITRIELPRLGERPATAKKAPAEPQA